MGPRERVWESAPRPRWPTGDRGVQKAGRCSPRSPPGSGSRWRAAQPAPWRGWVAGVGCSSGVAGRGGPASPPVPDSSWWGHRDGPGAPKSSLVHALCRDLRECDSDSNAETCRLDPAAVREVRQAARHSPSAEAHASPSPGHCPTHDLRQGKQPSEADHHPPPQNSRLR